jgi:predicted DsbA family dithiol-disulfide isomerase
MSRVRQNEVMSLVIPVAHDYICPWCWIAFVQSQRFEREQGVSFDWLGYELMPENLPWGTSTPAPEPDPRRPLTPTRMQLAYAASGMEAPTVVRPKQMRSHNALEATEHAKTHGVQDIFVDRMYRAYWEEGRPISDLDVIRELGTDLMDGDELVLAVQEKRYNDKIVPFDDEAYAAGIFNVPTFFIGGEKYAEQPYAVLERALLNALNR